MAIADVTKNQIRTLKELRARGRILVAREHGYGGRLLEGDYIVACCYFVAAGIGFNNSAKQGAGTASWWSQAIPALDGDILDNIYVINDQAKEGERDAAVEAYLDDLLEEQ